MALLPNGRPAWLPRAHPVSWWMLLVSTLAILITSIDRAILPTVLPDILEEFELTKTQGGVLVSLSFIGTFIGAMVLGVVGDLFGRGHHRARTWMITVAIACVASVATAFARSLDALRAWRVVMGIGTGGMSIGGSGGVVPPESWSRSTSRWSASGGRRRTAASRSASTTRASRSAS